MQKQTWECLCDAVFYSFGNSFTYHEYLRSFEWVREDRETYDSADNNNHRIHSIWKSTPMAVLKDPSKILHILLELMHKLTCVADKVRFRAFQLEEM